MVVTLLLLHDSEFSSAQLRSGVQRVLAAAPAFGSPPLGAQSIRVIWYSLGGKDLRGYRCRDHMYSARVSLGMLAEPERWPNALMALSVLRRGEVYEVRKVVLEVAHTQPLV